MSAPEKPEISVKPKRDPTALSSEYHKAHKQLMLWSAILFIWELVGVDLGKAKDAGGNVGPIVTALKSPQAVPWVVLILVLYFLFKCSIEWAQCHIDRRKIRVARLDFISAWVSSIGAILLYLGQTISRIQLADLLQRWGSALWPGAMAGSLLGVFMALGVQLFRLSYGDPVLSKKRMFPVLLIFVGILPLVAFLIAPRDGWPWILGFFLAGVPSIAILQVALKLPQFHIVSFAEKLIGPKKAVH